MRNFKMYFTFTNPETNSTEESYLPVSLGKYDMSMKGSTYSLGSARFVAKQIFEFIPRKDVTTLSVYVDERIYFKVRTQPLLDSRSSKVLSRFDDNGKIVEETIYIGDECVSISGFSNKLEDVKMWTIVQNYIDEVFEDIYQRAEE